ncbi:MAG: 1-acyl-sn-glycerol-3-phosphate acyltransferase [Coriobacteriia bacterium]|nr:1-acyl-sn-glycerol-3-phosphate acyltransferase [Coriobacteriia bacterium]
MNASSSEQQQQSQVAAKKEPRHARFRKAVLLNAGKQGEPKWMIRRILLFLASTIFLPLFRVRVTGAENLPQGPCIISPNHVSYYDGVLLFCITRSLKLPLRVLARRDLYRFAFLGWVLDSVGVMPVSRNAADREALSLASKAIKAGDVMAVFPEGTRRRGGSSQLAEDSQALGEASGGAAWLAIRNTVPIVPMAFAGTEGIRPEGVRLMRFPRVTISFGPVIDPDVVLPKTDYTKKERIARLTDLIMAGIANTLEAAQAQNAARTEKDGKGNTAESAGN